MRNEIRPFVPSPTETVGGEPAGRGGTAVPIAASEEAGQAPTPGGSRVPIYQRMTKNDKVQSAWPP